MELRLMGKPLVPLSGRTLQPKDLTLVLHRPVEPAVVTTTYALRGSFARGLRHLLG